MAILPFAVLAQEDSGKLVVPEATTNVTITLQAAPAPVAESLPAGETRQVEATVIVASGGSVSEAVDAVVGQMERVLALDLLGEADRAEFSKLPNRFGTAGRRIPWDKALEEVLRPTHFAYYEDGVIVKIGTREQVDALYATQQTEKLAANHTRIDPDFSGGMDIYMALCAIRIQAGISMNFDYMRPEHRGIVQPLAAVDQAQSGKVTVPTQQPATVKTTYAVPPGQKIEWRIVLKEVLDPISYTFIEDNGTVKPMPVEQLVKFNQAKINARPLVTKFIKVHHANAETIVEKLKKMNLLKHEKAFLDVSSGKDDNAKTYKGSSGGQLQAGSSGQRVGAQQSSGGAAFGDLKRPRTPQGILVADVEDNLAAIEDSIKLLDIREKQVLIEALILEVSDQMNKELGVKWHDLSLTYNSQLAPQKPQSFYQYDPATGEIEMEDVVDSEGNVIGQTPKTVLRIPTAEDLAQSVNLTDWAGKIDRSRFAVAPIAFDAVIKMIQGDTYSRVLGSPIITVGDHGEAVIQIATITPVEQSTANYIGTDNPTTVTTTEWMSLQTGHTLWVSPEISEDGHYVRLSVHPQIAEISGEVTASTKEKNYIVTSQELDTRVNVPTGEVLLLGGLTKAKQMDTVSKVPLLGDIPLLGRLFRYKGVGKGQSHLVLLIRPTILDDAAPNTGFETPSMKVIDPMMKGIGKTLDPNKGEDPIVSKEKSLLEKWGLRKKEEEAAGEAEEVPAEPVVNHGSTDTNNAAQ